MRKFIIVPILLLIALAIFGEVFSGCAGIDAKNIDKGEYPKSIKPTHIARWVTPGWTAITPWDAPMQSRTIVYQPIFVNEPTQYDAWGFTITKGNQSYAGFMEAKIYQWEDGLPTNMLYDLGSISTTVDGRRELAIKPITLQRGYYFLAYRPDFYISLKVRGINLGDPWTSPVQGFYVTPMPVADFMLMTKNGEWADPAEAPTGHFTAGYFIICLRES